MTKQQRAKVKKAIEDYEYYANGYHRLNGYSVKADKIGLTDNKEMVKARVTLYNCGEQDGKTTTETAEDCEYPLSLFKFLSVWEVNFCVGVLRKKDEGYEPAYDSRDTDYVIGFDKKDALARAMEYAEEWVDEWLGDVDCNFKRIIDTKLGKEFTLPEFGVKRKMFKHKVEVVIGEAEVA